MLVLDSGGVSRLTERTRIAAALISTLRDEVLWPPIVPTPVLVEALPGDPGLNAVANRLLKGCDIVEDVSEPLAGVPPVSDREQAEDLRWMRWWLRLPSPAGSSSRQMRRT